MPCYDICYAPGRHRVEWKPKRHVGALYFVRMTADGALVGSRRMLLMRQAGPAGALFTFPEPPPPSGYINT